MIRIVVALALTACAEQTFEERVAELEALAPDDCGTVAHTCAYSQQDVVKIVDCMNGHLAAGTGGHALRPFIDREMYAYAIDGELQILDRTYDYDLTWRWTERTCRQIGWHQHSPTCWGIEASDCDSE